MLWALALDGLPAGATARTIAALAGLPPYAGVTVAVIVLLAALQVLVGAWLARAACPGAARGGGRPGRTPGGAQRISAGVNIGRARRRPAIDSDVRYLLFGLLQPARDVSRASG